MHVLRGIKVKKINDVDESKLIEIAKSNDKTLILLGDGVFIDAYTLKKNSPNVYIQRILNMYQFQKTIEDYFYDEIPIVSILRLSEIDQWDREILWNIREALEIRYKMTNVESYIWIILDQEYCKPYVFEYLANTEEDDKWEEIPQVAEWK